MIDIYANYEVWDGAVLIGTGTDMGDAIQIAYTYWLTQQ